MNAGKDYLKALKKAQANANGDDKPRWFHSYGGHWWISAVEPGRVIDRAELVLPASDDPIMAPADRLASFLAAFGWHGGTIHQVMAATGIQDVLTLLYGKPQTGDPEYHRGYFARMAGTVKPDTESGNVQYWFGVMGLGLNNKILGIKEHAN